LSALDAVSVYRGGMRYQYVLTFLPTSASLTKNCAPRSSSVTTS
jgi:hypothetical protein